MQCNVKLSLGLIMAASLVACGGGGGSSTTASSGVATLPVTTPTAPTVTPADLQTTVPALTYAANSPEFAFVTAYNRFRGQLGLGLLAQNAALDKAAASHLKYVNTYSADLGGTVDMAAINPTYNTPNFHIEDAAKAGFTGAQVADRAKAAGYNGAYLGENGSYGMGLGGEAALGALMASIYHRQSLMLQSPRDIGVAIGTDQFQTTVENFGYQSKPQSNAGDYVGVYPANNQTLVPLFSAAESPNPYSDITNNTNEIVNANTSYPITLVIKEFATLAVTSFTVTEDGQAAPLKVRLFTAASDTRLASWTSMIVGYAPFKPKTKYNVSFAGTANGASFTRSWSFTTATSCTNYVTCN
jgi:uncharacterized protein YkwD